MKTFKLRFDDVEQVITEKAGAAVASDRIAVDGEPVRVMERTTPCEATDSGWLFLAGDETPAALRNRRKSGVYHLNHLANHTPAIVPFLRALPGQRFTFNRRRGAFVEARDSKPDLPAAKLSKGITVQGPGRVDLEANWSLDLSSPFRRRFEDESHVFWRPLMTVWVYGVARRTPLSELKARLLTPTAYDVSESEAQRCTGFGFECPAAPTAPARGVTRSTRSRSGPRGTSTSRCIVTVSSTSPTPPRWSTAFAPAVDRRRHRGPRPTRPFSPRCSRRPGWPTGA